MRAIYALDGSDAIKIKNKDNLEKNYQKKIEIYNVAIAIKRRVYITTEKMIELS